MTILDLEQDPVAFFPNLIDVVQFYIPRVALEEFVYENRTAPVSTLRWPHCEIDTTLKHLGMTVLSAIQRCKPAPKVFLDYIGQTILACHLRLWRNSSYTKSDPRALVPLAGATRERAPDRKLVRGGSFGFRSCRMQFIGKPFCPCFSAELRATSAPLAYGPSRRT